MADPRTIAISYSREHERSGEARGMVAKLVESAKAARARVLWDGEDAEFGASLDSFMRRIAGANMLVVFLSDEYLKSDSCMYELLTAWQACRANPAQFREQIRVWVMPNAGEIFKLAASLATYTPYWQRMAEEAEAKIKGVPLANLGSKTHEKYKRRVEIGLYCDEILGFIADSLSPRSFSDFVAWVAAEFPEIDAINGSGPTHDEIRSAFGDVYESVRRIFGENKALRDLLAKKIGFPEEVADKLVDRAILHLHANMLPAIGLLKQLHDQSTHKKELLDLVASVLYLAMEPAYATMIRRQDIPFIPISDQAGQGILDILTCWVQHKPKVILRASSKEKPPGKTESTPVMAYREIKLAMMDRLGIDPRSPEADIKLSSLLEAAQHFGDTEQFRLPEHDQELVRQIKAPLSPLRNLLLFVTIQGQSINSHAGKDFDLRLETHLSKLREIFNPS